MKETLLGLTALPGIRGALIMTLDGVIVAAAPDTLDHARVAAFLSAVLAAVGRSAEALGLVPLQRLTLTAARGRLVLVPVGDLALAVVADEATDLAAALVEATALARRVHRHTRIDVPA